MENVITIYTDGACSGNPGKGGWAAIIIAGNNEKIISGSEPMTTNNRMELIAVIKALQPLQSQKIYILTYSNYLKVGI